MRIGEAGDERKVDLSALDPDQDPAAVERFVGAVMGRLAGHPIPRAMPADPLIGIWSIARGPALAAGIIFAIAIGALSVGLNRDDAPPTIVQAIGVPPEFFDAALVAAAPEGR